MPNLRTPYSQTITRPIEVRWQAAQIASLMDELKVARALFLDNFELADEEEYAKTDPISYDELMGVRNEH